MKTKAIVSSITVLISLLVSSGLYAAGSAQDFLRAGEKAVGQQQFDTAVQHLSKALGGEDLSSEDTAKALYFRGVAYNGKGEPARSIADLTRAIFFKKIPSSLKSQILQARAKAYRAVGLGSRAEADLRAAGVGGTRVASVNTTSTSTFSTTQRAQPTQRRAAVTSGWGANVNAVPAKPVPVQPIRQPQREIQPVQRQQPQRLASNSYSRQQQQDARRMFETKPRPVRRTTQTVAKKNTHSANLRSSDFGSERQAQPRRIAHTENVQTIRKPVQPRASSSGRYRLQLAAVSSENAQNAWSQLVAKHNSLLSNQNPDFQTVNLGNNKSVVRIQIGPFADKLQTLQLCNTFKQEGLDCFLVVR